MSPASLPSAKSPETAFFPLRLARLIPVPVLPCFYQSLPFLAFYTLRLQEFFPPLSLVGIAGDVRMHGMKREAIRDGIA